MIRKQMREWNQAATTIRSVVLAHQARSSFLAKRSAAHGEPAPGRAATRRVQSAHCTVHRCELRHFLLAMGVCGFFRAFLLLGMVHLARFRSSMKRGRGPTKTVFVDLGIARAAVESSGNGVTASTFQDEGQLARAVKRAKTGCVRSIEQLVADYKLGAIDLVFLADAPPDERARVKGNNAKKKKQGTGLSKWTYERFFPSLYKALEEVAPSGAITSITVRKETGKEADDSFGGTCDYIISGDVESRRSHGEDNDNGAPCSWPL